MTASIRELQRGSPVRSRIGGCATSDWIRSDFVLTSDGGLTSSEVNGGLQQDPDLAKRLGRVTARNASDTPGEREHRERQHRAYGKSDARPRLGELARESAVNAQRTQPELGSDADARPVR